MSAPPVQHSPQPKLRTRPQPGRPSVYVSRGAERRREARRRAGKVRERDPGASLREPLTASLLPSRTQSLPQNHPPPPSSPSHPPVTDPLHPNGRSLLPHRPSAPGRPGLDDRPGRPARASPRPLAWPRSTRWAGPAGRATRPSNARGPSSPAAPVPGACGRSVVLPITVFKIFWKTEKKKSHTDSNMTVDA